MRLKKNFKRVLIIFLIFSWIFSGFPPIWESSKIPVEVFARLPSPTAQAAGGQAEETATSIAISTSENAMPQPSTWQPDFTPASGVAAQVKENGEAKIDLSTLNFFLPPGAGELELYALPDRCLGTLPEIKRNLMTYPYCGDPIGFAVSRPQDYSWIINSDERVVLGFCQNADIDCGDNPEAFKIVFISDEVLRPGIAAGAHPLSLKP